MKVEEALEILKKHNEWRRDDSVPNSKEMVNPTTLGIAIDTITEFIFSNQK